MDPQTEATLKMTLQMAVPLWIMDYKQKPWEELTRISTEASEFLGEHGDALMYKQKGTTAKAFNHLAKGLAVLSFAPGGVNFSGLHFEAVHPESLTGKGARWFFYSALADALPDMADRGLYPVEESRSGGELPDWAKGKVFLAETQDQAAHHAARVFRNALEKQGWSWDPILLRVHSAHLADAVPDPHSFHDWSVERKIPWTFLQVWVPEKQAWIEVREAVKQHYFDEFRTKYGKPGKLQVEAGAEPREYAQQYIEQFWPTREQRWESGS